MDSSVAHGEKSDVVSDITINKLFFVLSLKTFLKSYYICVTVEHWLNCIFLLFQVITFLQEQMKGEEPGEGPGGNVESNEKMASEIFEHEDKDKDGFISHEEFSGPKHDEL